MTGLTIRCRVTLAYDGSGFSGWQVQPDRPSIQGALEAVLQAAVGSAVRVTGSGRTDAGVHALGQVAHFDVPDRMPTERLQAACNARLPASIRLRDLQAVDPSFHALRAVKDKTYFYQLHLSRAVGGARIVESSVPPFRRFTFHAVRADLDLAAMRRAARCLEGRHDFTALSKTMEPGRDTCKTVRTVRILRVSHGLRLFFTGDGFLYGMVRLMAACLLDVGRGRLSPEALAALLAAGKRGAGPAALPAHALFLWRVRYPTVGGSGDGPLS